MIKNMVLSDSIETLLTPDVGESYKIFSIFFTNITEDVQELNLFLNEDDTSPDNEVVTGLPIPPKDTYVFDENIFLSEGNVLKGECSEDGAVKVTISYFVL